MKIFFRFSVIPPEIINSAFIAPTASIIGDIKIGAGSGTCYNCELRGDMDEIRIGENSNVQDSTILHVASLGQGTFIGTHVSIGQLALIHACTDEDGAMFGMQATVVHGALIKVGELVAAGSLVQSLTKQLRSKDLRVGIVAVHPSSPFTGGAIMGDSIRMG